MLHDDLAQAARRSPADPHVEPVAEGGGLADTVLAALHAAGIRWCLLRRGLYGQTRDDDIDILVARADLPRAVALMRACGLIRVPSYGRGTEVSYVGLDQGVLSWVEFDLVTAFDFGHYFEVRTDAAEQCLARRQWRHGVWELAPEDEFWALLLHVMLDKIAFGDRHLPRLAELQHLASPDSPLFRAMPEAISTTLLGHAWAEDLSALMSLRPALLAAWWRAHPVSTIRTAAASAALRVLERPLRARRRPSMSVALLGPDGAGKSTLAQGITSAFYFPVRRIYFGLWKSGPTGCGTAQQALRVVTRPFTVLRRSARSLWHRVLGRLVVFDRYVYDAMLPPRGSFVWLKRPYFRLLIWLCPAPDLVLLLDAPGRVMHARSNDNDAERLEADRRQYQLLGARIPSLQHLDADRPAEVVLRDAVGRIWQHYVRRAER